MQLRSGLKRGLCTTYLSGAGLQAGVALISLVAWPVWPEGISIGLHYYYKSLQEGSLPLAGLGHAKEAVEAAAGQLHPEAYFFS